MSVFIDTETEQVEKTIPIGPNPTDMTINHGEGLLCVTDWVWWSSDSLVPTSTSPTCSPEGFAVASDFPSTGGFMHATPGDLSARLELHVGFKAGRKHLPVVELRPAA